MSIETTNSKFKTEYIKLSWLLFKRSCNLNESEQMLKPEIINQAELDWESWEDPEIAAISPVRWKLLITSERCRSNGIVTGIAEVPPDASLLLHHHEPEETYYVISGNGYMKIDDCEGNLSPGTAVYIPPNSKHTVRCTGTEPLVFIFTFARDSFSQIEYIFDE